MTTVKMPRTFIQIVYVLLLFATGVLLYEQDAYSLKFEYAETIRFNPDYFRQFKVISFKCNRTHFAMNQTLWYRVDVGSDVKIEVQAYRFASNEFRVFPLRFSFDYCKSLLKGDYGLQDLFACGNFTRCPLKKGKYFICNWAPDARRFPPLIPEGQYMLDLKYFVRTTEISFYRIYGTIKNKHLWD